MSAYPHGARLRVDAQVKELPDATLLGGSPRRLLRLSPAGRRAYDALRTQPVSTSDQARLARQLTDAGVLHPRVVPVDTVEATVLVPVRDRADALEDCLRALGGEHGVLVVDDGSIEPDAIAKVCAEHGARYLARPVNGGPAAARNTGLAEIDSEFVLLLDSDCVPPPGLVHALAGHFADPVVAAVAPRVVGDTGYLSPLDLGAHPGNVAPGRVVGYVPTAALLVRRSVLPAFDEDLRYGEDVDLIWRLVEAGHVVRYDPATIVIHTEPRSWSARVRRRFHYGTSAPRLDERHPGAVPPLLVHPWSALSIVGLLTRHPLLCLAGLVGAYRELHAVVPPRARADILATSVTASALGLSRWTAQFALPLLLVSARRRPGVLCLLLAAPLTRWWPRRARIDPLRFVAAELAGDAAYGAGVTAACLRTRNLHPLRPVSTRHRGKPST